MLEFYLRVLFLVKVYLDKAKDVKEIYSQKTLTM